MMGGFSIWHWLIVGIVVMLLFGKGRFSDMMGDVAKGLKSFKKGMAEEDGHPAPSTVVDPRSAPPRVLDGPDGLPPGAIDVTPAVPTAHPNAHPTAHGASHIPAPGSAPIDRP